MQILIIGKVWPEPKSSAAGRRMIQLIDFFKTLGEVLFVTGALPTGFEEELSVPSQLIKLNDSSFDELLKNIIPEIVVFDRFMTEEQFSWRVKEICPDAVRILNTEDLHFLRKTRENALKMNRSLDHLDFNTEDAFREITCIHKSDLTLLISDVEHDLLINQFAIPLKNLFHLPIFSDGQNAGLPNFEERKDLIFIGNFLHSPNLDAVRYLKQEIWPRFREQRNDIAIHIYGAYPTQEVLEMNAPKDLFHVHGRIDEVSEILRNARICFSPLRFGAGIKGKIIDSMESGLPIVTTSIGAEGIAESSKFPGFISDSLPQMMADLLILYDNDEVWKAKQEIGKELLINKFQRSFYEHEFEQKIKACMNNRGANRQNSFEVNLIRYQGFQNSKYFSKWINEKNK